MRCGKVVEPSGLPGQLPPTATLRIRNCGCVNTQVAPLGKLAGVSALEFNLLSRVLGVWHALPDEQTIIAAINELGFSAQPVAAVAPDHSVMPSTRIRRRLPRSTQRAIRLTC